MLEICRRHTSTTNGKIRLGVGVSVLFIVAMVFGMLVFAKPYAVYATGEKVAEPWVVSIDNEEVAVVESKEAGESVLTGLRAAYCDTVAEQQNIDLGQDIVVERYQFEDAKDHPLVMTASEALDYILEENETDNPVLEISTKEIVSGEEEIPYKKVEKDDADLLKGQKKVETYGVVGKRAFTAEASMINGKEVSRTELSSKVVVAPVTEVILVGTKEPEKEPAEVAATTSSNGSSHSNSSSSSSYSRSSYTPPASGCGSSVANYAVQFVGLPYVWGGTSLSSGVDCSGFTQQVYRACGASLPRTSYAQGGCGTYVAPSDRAPGDLMCYGGHVGIYIGGGQMVHASSPGVGVVVQAVYGSPQYRRII